MRRRLRARSGRGGAKPTRMAWTTTAVILTAAFLWYILHLFSTYSFGCEAVIAWWFEGDRFQPGLLQVSSLFVMTLALWLYVDMIRPKPERVPAGIRVVQTVLVTVMVMMSVSQWGFFRPQSDEGHIYTDALSEASRWPLARAFLPFAQGGYEVLVEVPVEGLDGSLVAAARAAQEAYEQEFPAFTYPYQYGRAGGRYNGRLECTARREVTVAWDRVYEAYFRALEAEAAQDREAMLWKAPSGAGD